MNPKNYRPISLLPIIGKIVERTVQKQIVDFMEQTEQFNPSSHSYRKIYSTSTAILQLTDQIQETTDLNQISCLLTVDESSAFDCVDHTTLDKKKLEQYNISQNTRTWINSYLTNRTEYTSIGTKNSPMKPVLQGVPQGSVLGPVLFTIYTNEISVITKELNCLDNCLQNTSELYGTDCRKCGIVPTFADNATILVTSTNREGIQHKLETKLDNITTFLNSNSLTVNRGNTTITECMTRQKRMRLTAAQPSLVTTDENGERKVITQTKENRLLGINLHENLTWNSHLSTGEKSIIPAVRKKLGALKFMSKTVPQKGRLLLANGMLISKIIYLIPVWGGAETKYLKQLQVLLNKAARYVTGKNIHQNKRTNGNLQVDVHY